LQNSWGFEYGLGVNVCSEDLGMELLVINFYGPYQDQALFWESLLNKSFMNFESLILGGDLNFSVGVIEVWGPKPRIDPLLDFLIHILGDKGMSDAFTVKLNPTWRNKRIAKDRIEKKIDCFLVS
jgi:hypothetical protein